ncbi:hypothetical protein TWF730_006309 [Orbilia blumenaviensis]|uniref:Nucleoside phosphorylase domain-containing protein n=1 Tax=Orbilia blumenaviensis TaxID=1796055 RepID=A0AAV9VGX5_9PEZI
MSQSNSTEWHILRTLGWILNGRLAKYGPSSHKTKLARRCILLEVTLRETLALINSDSDMLRTYEGKYLRPMIQLLNSLVNKRVVTSEESSSSPKSEYSMLRCLISFLQVNSNDFDRRAQLFDLVHSTRGDLPIFHIASPDIAKDAYKKVSRFHDSLIEILNSLKTTSTIAHRKRARSPSRESGDFLIHSIDRVSDPQFREHTKITINALHSHLVCKAHKIMLRLEKELQGELDLFLSGCQNTELWHEIRCQCYMSGIPTHQVDNICETLPEFPDQRIQLIVDVDADPDKVHYSTLSTSRTYPEATFSRSLDYLIEAGLLQEINLKNISSLPANIFSRKEKYTLAHALGICFLNFFDAGFMKQSWNSSSILFLVPKSRRTQDGFLYIHCSPQETYHEEPYFSGHPVLTAFARLLLEIYCGEPFLPENENLEHLFMWAKLSAAVDRLQNHDQSSYLKAVSGCLRLTQQLYAQEDCEDLDAKVRELVYEEIVKHLESELGGLTRKRQLVEHNPSEKHPIPISQNATPDYRYDHRPPSTPLAESRNKFNIAIICALPIEADAVQAMFDKTHKGNQAYTKASQDENIYTTGRIGNYNIVLCHLPRIGNTGAASAAKSLQLSYPDIELTLVVGICGGIPLRAINDEAEVHLGDIIISDSLIKYDLGQQLPDKFQRRGYESALRLPGPRVQGLLAKLKTTESKNDFQEHMLQCLQALQKQRKQYQYPGVEHDKLFPADYNHRPRNQASLNHCKCSHCRVEDDPMCDRMRKRDCNVVGCAANPVSRVRHNEGNTQPLFHIGKIGCADTVMKSGTHRDQLAKEEDIIGLEMEGSGVWSHGPCLVIKGVSDYADSHKNDKWQPYAAATAASAAKAFLHFWASNP